MELCSRELSTMLFWSRIEYFGIATIPAWLLLFVFQYSGRDHWLTRRNYLLLFTIPLITIALHLTDNLHHLVYQTVAVDYRGVLPLLVFTHGPWYWVSAANIIVSILAGSLLLWQHRAHAPILYRAQTDVLIAGAIIPFLVFLLYVSGKSPLGDIDINPFGFTFMGLSLSWVVFRHRLFDLAPIARNTVIEKLCDGVIVLDSSCRIVDANPAALRIFGWVKTPIGQLLVDAWQAWPELQALPLDGGRLLAVLAQSDGCAPVSYDVTSSVLRDRKEREIGYIVLVHDITVRRAIEYELYRAKDAAETATAELQRAWDNLEVIASTDKLTGAYNRRKFDELIENEITRVVRYHTSLSLIMLDIDHFKQINDQYGHLVGDEVLATLSRLIGTHTRDCDSFIRWGGEEFILLTPAITLEQAVFAAEKLRLLVADTVFSGVCSITISLGVAQYEITDTADSLIRRADDALYRAKARGRNRTEAEEYATV